MGGGEKMVARLGSEGRTDLLILEAGLEPSTQQAVTRPEREAIVSTRRGLAFG